MSAPEILPGDEIVLGFARGEDGQRVSVTASSEAVIRHTAIIGTSDGGKTVFAAATITQLVRQDPRLPCIVVDPKGELCGGLATYLTALAGAMPEGDQKAFLSGFRAVAPFRHPLPLNILAREPGVEPEVQALGVMDAIQAALDDDIAGFARISSVLQVTLTAAIEAGLKLPDVVRMLVDAPFRKSVEERLPQGRTREMLGTRPKTTAAASIAALVARLDRLLSSSLLREILSADTCFTFADRLETGVTLVDLSDPPAGERGVQKLLGNYLIQRLSQALLSRTVVDTTRPLMVAVDELPEVASGRACDEIGRLLALVRFKRVGVTLLFQDENQLARSPELLALLKANTARLIVFRGNPQSLRWIEPFLPRPILKAASPLQKPPAGAADAFTRALLMRMGDLPNRIAMHVDRAAGEHGQFMSTAFVDQQDVKRRASAAPQHVKEALEGLARVIDVTPTLGATGAAASPRAAGKNKNINDVDNINNINGSVDVKDTPAPPRATGPSQPRPGPASAASAPYVDEEEDDASGPPKTRTSEADIPCTLGWVPWCPSPGGRS